MLAIRKAQIDALSDVMRQSFEDRMVEHMAADFPTQFAQLQEPGARELVRAGIERCAGYGIDTEAGIRFVVDVLLEYPDFDGSRDMAWARKILDDGELSGQAKVKLIEKRLEAAKARLTA